MIEEQFRGIVARVLELIRKAWTGQVVIEINLTQGALGSIYFTAKEKINTKKKGQEDQKIRRIK